MSHVGVLFPSLAKRILEQEARPLADHLAEYRKYLVECKQNTEHHNKDTLRRARVILRLCRKTLWPDVMPEDLDFAIAKVYAPRTRAKNATAVNLARPLNAIRKRRKDGIGISTLKQYIHSIKAFANWMVNKYRASYSPCLSLNADRYRAELDVRRERRALTRTEMLALIKAATNGPTICRIPGTERAMLYTIAWTTGLRVGEIESLTRKSFALGEDPCVKIEAAYSKNRRRDALPLRADVTKLVTEYLAQVWRDDKLFRRPKGNGTRALRKDLAAAGIEYCVDKKYADHHSLRHTFISDLFDTGATAKEAQSLARHQDARLTLGRYAHVTEKAKRGAVERLGGPNTAALERAD